MALFGSATPLSKIIATALPVFSASLLRMVIAIAVLAPFIYGLRHEFAAADRKDWMVIVLISLAGMVGFTAAMLFGMRLTTGVIGATVMSATPALTAAAAVIFLGAAITWRKGAALGLAVIGILALNLLREPEGGGGELVWLGTALVVLAICFEAAYTLLSKQLSGAVSSLTATFAASFIAIPAFALLALLFDPKPFDYSGAGTHVWLAVAFWGAATGGLAPVLWYNGVRRSPGVLAAGFMSVMPISALVLSYVLLGESFRWVHVVGFGLVFTGLVLMIREHTVSGSECH